jgi:hypothetical protein
MIYVLMQYSGDYESHDIQIFASTSKSKVEDKHEELLKRNKHFTTIYGYFKVRADALDKTMPPLVAPEYAELPPRPLVWANGHWNNAYALEHAELERQRAELRKEETQKILADLGDFFSVPMEEMEQISEYAFFKEYYITEVESD